MNLSSLQTQLCARYDIGALPQVHDFLITESAALGLKTEGTSAAPPREMLLVREAADALELSLFIDGRILERLAQSDPLRYLHRQNLDDFLVALEGVSHFLYLAFNANHDRPVSLFELELQAEVDKFLTVRSLLERQGQAHDSRELHRLLFDAPRLGDWVTPELVARYRDANFYAGKYCWALCKTPAEKAGELPGFYRMGRNDKLRHINARREALH